MIFCFTRGTEQSQSRPKLSLPQELPCSKADVTAVYNANTLYLDKWILFNKFARRMFTVAFSQTLVFPREPQTYCAEDERIHIHATELSSESLLPACAATIAESKQWQCGSLFP